MDEDWVTPRRRTSWTPMSVSFKTHVDSSISFRVGGFKYAFVQPVLADAVTRSVHYSFGDYKAVFEKDTLTLLEWTGTQYTIVDFGIF